MIFRHSGAGGKKATRGCPCGYLGADRCQCTPDQVQRYRSRISGPLLDRIDIHTEVPAVSHSKLRDEPEGEPTECIRERVLEARARQSERQDCLNRDLDIQATARHCAPAPAAQALLDRAMEQLGLSARAYHKVLRLARTVADLGACADLGVDHVGEAIQLRCLDRRS